MKALLIFFILITAVSAKEFRVVTYNLKRATHPETLAVAARELVRLAKPDAILLQEVRFPHGDVNSAEIMANAIGYSAFGAPRKNGREGVAVLTRLPTSETQVLHLDGAYPPFYWHRVSVAATFRLESGEEVRVVSTHLPNFPWEGGLRLSHVAQTLNWIGGMPLVDITVFGGDLNAARKTDEVGLVTARNRWKPLEFADYNTDSGTFNNGKRLDYLFTSIDSRVAAHFIREQILFTRGIASPVGGRIQMSDHYPLLHVYEVGDR